MLEFAAIWAFLLLPLPLVLRRILPPHREPRPGVQVPFLGRMAALTGRKPEAGSATAAAGPFPTAVLLLSWILIVAAVARPQWIEQPVTRTVPTRDLLLAVDLSGSMEAEDFTDPEGRRTDRLTAVKLVLDDFLSRREGDRVGLIFFGSAPFVQAPFTEDLSVLRTLLDEAQVRMAGPQTMLGDAIGLAVNVFDSAETEDRVLVLLTDGNDTESRMPPARAAAVARDRGITIHTVAVGDPEAVGEDRMDEETLRSVAESTGGGYFRAMNREEMENVYRKIDAMRTRDIETVSHRPRRDLFHWPLGAGLGLCFALHFFGLAPSIGSGRTEEAS